MGIRARAAIGALAVIATLAAGASTAQADGTYVALGDSLAAGVGASSSSHGYVGVLSAALTASAGVTESFNYGQSGATSASLRGSQLASALARINDPSDTTYVTIEIGGNDLLNGTCNTNWDEPACPFRDNFSDTLDDLLAALAADPGTATLATMAYYNPSTGRGSSAEADLDAKLFGANGIPNATDTGADVGLNDVILQESLSRGLPMADPYPYFKTAGQAWMSNDGIHPNDNGYAAIAQTFCDVVPASCSVFTLPQPTPPVPTTPPATPMPGTDPPDTDPPETRIDKSPPRKSSKRRVRVAFSADEPGSTFKCRLDGAAFKRCSSPLKLRVKRGRHRVQVRATDAAGNADPTPAAARFKVKKKR